MANLVQTVIKLKTGRGVPSAGTLMLGEAGYDLDSNVLYIGGDAGAIVKVSDRAAVEGALSQLGTDIATLTSSVNDEFVVVKQSIVDNKASATADLTAAKAVLEGEIASVGTTAATNLSAAKTDLESQITAVSDTVTANKTATDAAVSALDIQVAANTSDIADLKASVTGSAVTLAGDQTITGEKTFTVSPLVPTAEVGDSSTKAASTGFVASAATSLSNKSVTVRGTDVSGTGSIEGGFDLELADVGTAGTYAKVTTDAKGRVTAGSDLVEADIPELHVAKIVDFASAVHAVSLDQFASPVATVDFNKQTLTGLAEPVDLTDAVTKGYVDAVAQGLHAKAAARVATTENVTLSGLQTVDGVALVADNRIVVKNQTNATENGIYVVAAGAWQRTPEHDAWEELVSAFVFVEEGTQNSDTGWVCTADRGGSIGTTDVEWVQFSAAGTVLPGAGLSKSGNLLNVVGTAGRISVGASGVDIDAAYAGQASINTVGTITTGEWQGTAVAVAHGGTGLTTAVEGIVKGEAGVYKAATEGVDYMSKASTDIAIAAAIAIIDGGTY